MDRTTTALRRTRIEATEDDFSAGEVLVEGVRTWLLQLPMYGGVAFLVHLPLLGLIFVRALPGWLLVPIFFAAELFAVLLVKAALVKAVLDERRGLPSEFRELLEAVNRKGPAALAVGTTILAGALAKMVKLVLPGIVYLCETFAAVPEVIVEGSSTSAAVRRSEQLIVGARPQVFAVCLLIWTLAGALPFLIGLHHGGHVIHVTSMIFYLALRSLDSSLAAVLAATAYSRLLQRD
ncbi:MAG: hypothetical protein ABR567_03950 [Myxococcales bacterium]|nr:hypothetical protein [Myxococcales bacterium]